MAHATQCQSEEPDKLYQTSFKKQTLSKLGTEVPEEWGGVCRPNFPRRSQLNKPSQLPSGRKVKTRPPRARTDGFSAPDGRSEKYGEGGQTGSGTP